MLLLCDPPHQSCLNTRFAANTTGVHVMNFGLSLNNAAGSLLRQTSRLNAILDAEKHLTTKEIRFVLERQGQEGAWCSERPVDQHPTHEAKCGISVGEMDIEIFLGI